MSSTPTSELSRRTITSFALIVSGALLAIAAYQWWQDAPHRGLVIALVVIATLLLLLAAVAPSLLRPVYRGWMHFGEALGWLNTRILLTLVFFLVVTPIGLLMRLFGRSPITTAKRDSYWTDVEPHSYGDRHVEKQF